MPHAKTPTPYASEPSVLPPQVTFERKRREVHDVNVASKANTSLVSGALSKGADRFHSSNASGSKFL
jgi:hypothetical protein